MPGPRLAAAIVAAVLTLTPALAASSAAARVPQGFVGMVVGPPVFPDPPAGVDLGQQLDTMVSSGVERIRVAVSWGDMQPYPAWSSVPASRRSEFETDGVDRVPTRFAQLDALVGAAAARGLTVLPTVLAAPVWDGWLRKSAVVYAPRSNRPYGNFLRALVRRYGPRGTFWRHGPRKLPIRAWQIWNEPNEFGLWPYKPFAPSYVALLRTAHAAIKAADPRAKIVLAGLSNYSWKYLAQIYAVRGAARLFDVVGIHPYTREPRGVITILGYARQVMNRHGDRRKPLEADEMGWPSSVGQTSYLYGFETNEAGQAANTKAVLPMLARARKRLGLLGFYFYTWAGTEHPGAYTFDFAGLLRFSAGKFIAKPAFSAFKRAALALESCRVKGPVATRCARRS